MQTIRSRKGIASLVAAALLYVGVAGTICLHAQDPTTPPTSMTNALPPDATAEYIFKNNCATCHGVDGAGANPQQQGFTQPFPNGDTIVDFTDCPTNSTEKFVDWSAVIHRGGPIRGLDRHMPAFGDALTDEQIEALVHYLWTLCSDKQWPRGDLNFPRAFFTEKAYPESESVWTGQFQTTGAKQQLNVFNFEHRIKKRSMYEVSIPVGFMQTSPNGAWTRGLGDVELAIKRAFWADIDHGAIFAAGGAVTMPTGKEETGLGEGVTIWEPFAMFDKSIGETGFVQFHGGYMQSSNRATVQSSAYLRQAWGRTFAGNHGFGRSWTPIAEVLWSKQANGGRNTVDVVPQMQVSLNKLQHILISVGVDVPAANKDGRHPQFLTYFLWDWEDGGLTQYWK